MTLDQPVLQQPVEGDGVSGLLVICVDPALGRNGRAVCDTAAQRLLAEPVLGGYTEVRGVVLPRTDDEALTETRLLLAGTLGDVTPGAELYFCGVLVATKMVGDSRTVGEALGEDSGVPVRLREISVPGKPSRLEYEKTVFDEVQAAARQLFEDGSREPDRGATLAQLMDWSAALALQPTDSATSAEASEPEPEQVEPEQIEPEEVEQEGAEQDEVEQDGAEREERSWPRFQLVSRWRRKPKPQAADQTFSATDEARLAYLLILADGTTPPTAWQRCRSIVRDFDKAVAKEEKARGYQLRLLAGGDSVVAQSALRPAGEADRRDLKAPASSYIDLARVISDVEVMLDRDSDSRSGTPPLALPVFVVLAATTPLLDTNGLEATERLCGRARVTWLVLDERAEIMLGQLRTGGVTLLRDHSEIVPELVRDLLAASDEQHSTEQADGVEPSAERSTGEEQ